MNLSPELIQDLVTVAFCLEPLSEKEGCTSRSNDLPDKPPEAQKYLHALLIAYLAK